VLKLKLRDPIAVSEADLARFKAFFDDGEIERSSRSRSQRTLRAHNGNIVQDSSTSVHYPP
jgi:hypothetical protein